MNEISLHILDIVQNAIAAGAGRIEVNVSESGAADRLDVTVADDGCGMDEEQARLAQEPFTTSRKTRKVGLGLPLFKEGCLRCEGEFGIESRPGAGTRVKGSYRLSHIDRPPLGDMADTVFLLVAANPTLDIAFTHSRDGRSHTFDTKEIRRVLGGVELDHPDVLQWVREWLNDAEKDLHGGAPDT